MKEIYDWVHWFQELARNIANEGEAYLIEKARQVEWGGKPSLLQYGDEAIDPFSFFYFLASKAGTNQLKTVYDSVSHKFGIESPLADPSVDEHYIFPTPQARFSDFYEKTDSCHELLWRLFNDAVKDEPTIVPTDFEDALKLNGVGVTRLTQTMFLINPGFFQPVDNITDDLSKALGLSASSTIETDIRKEGGYEKYRAFLEMMTEAFPGCQPYEVNMLLYLVKPKSKNRIELTDQFYQISTYVFDPGGGDYWNDFEENNWVYTGGPGSGKSWEEEGGYPLTQPARGDIILVRTGRQRGRAIGIVQKNDYAESGIKENNRIHVLWISKADKGLSSFTAMQGLSKAGAATYRAFETSESYKRSFELIYRLRGSSTMNEAEPDLDGPQPVEPATKNPNPLNQILYGPPGTSKTWHTVNHALAIIDNGPVDQLEMENKGDREDKMRRFEALKKNGQIEMVTFHQNYNYEDFIEGIRPVLADDIDEEGKVEYELSRGVFREIGERARENWMRSQQKVEISWDMDDLLNAFGRSVDDRLDSEEQIDLFPLDRKRGTRIVNIRWLRDGQFKSVWAGTENSWRYLTKDVIKKHYMAFYDGEIKSEADIGPTRESKQTQHAHAHYYFALFEKIKEFHDKEWQPIEPAAVQRQIYVLIIDEINRGNIAKIFGELITLIEESKRIGGDDQATVTLPYSKEEFGVPDNLYIIGTMNTADRSIALLDTALRRRFDFIEMMPDSKLVSGKFEGVDCRKLHEAINKRIRFLFDREHQIGHTYFMHIDRMESLEETFKNKIIPLLQEYFYDNWEKIDLVLNRNGFIQKIQIESDLFKDSDLIDDQTQSYELLPLDDGKWQDPEQYRKIYENDKQGDAGES